MEEMETFSAVTSTGKISPGECRNWKFINTICRLCSLECQSNAKDILQKNILDMLKYCSFLCPSETDALPRLICSSCFESLTGCYVFKRKIEATDALLKNKLRIKLIPKQDILDIALSEAEIKNPQNENDLKASALSAISKNNLGIARLIGSSDKNSVSCEEDEIKAKVNRTKNGKEQKAINNEDPPPLVPIQIEKSERKLLPKVPPQEPPPLVPLGPITHEALPSTIDLGEFSEDVQKEEHFNLESSEKNPAKLSDQTKTLFCNICRKEFNDGKKLIGHLKGHMVPKNFACKICGKKYPNPSTFHIHMRSHTGERPFKCPVCNKGFTRWAGVVSHMQSHEDNRPFKCDSCDQSFKILSNLERHKVLHSEVMPFCCNYCGKTFSQSANLQLHIRTYHTKERPYLCSECGKGFVSSTRLNRHMWVHSGYKPFLCKICSKAYSNAGDLRNHESSAHGDGDSDKPYACNLCDKRFFYSCRLNKHLKTHQRPYACSQCSKTFRSSSVLDQHFTSKHSETTCTNISDSRTGVI